MGKHCCFPGYPTESIRLLFPGSRSTMNQELCAYLVRGDGRVSEMPIDELLVAIEHLMQAGIAQGQSISSDKAAVYEFLQTLKRDRKSTRLNSSHSQISYAVFCLKKKNA